VPVNKRTELFIEKLNQCKVLFDFNDPSSDLKGKEIKSQALQEMIEYIVTTKGAISSGVYIHVIKMVN
jgi:serine/threonine-protein phosphatase 2A regulatory subunit B'